MRTAVAALMRRSDSRDAADRAESAVASTAGAPPQRDPDRTLAEIMASRARPKPLLAGLNQALLGRLPGLLGQPASSEVASARVATCIRLFVLCSPPLKPLMLRQLEAELHRCGACHGSARVRSQECSVHAGCGGLYML